MSRPAVVVARAAGALLALAAAVPAQASVSAGTIGGLVRASGLAGMTSVTVLRDDGSVLYARAQDRARVPASNEKLLTAVTALDVLGPRFRFTTEARISVAPQSGVVHGPLYLLGAGDPTLRTGDLVRLAQRVKAAGIDLVTGGVIADGSRFDRRRGGPGWGPGYVGHESAPLSALTVDGNMLGADPVADPELRAATVFRRALRLARVHVSGPAVSGRRPAFSVAVASVASLPLERILRVMLKDSDNFTAEMVLKAIAAYSGRPGTTWFGARIVRETLQRRGLDLRGVRTADGSGLSPINRVTTRFLAALLREAQRDPRVAGALRQALAIAGVDGTLRRRMRGTAARGRVRAKTGTLHLASALSGYAPRYVFSIVAGARQVPTDRAQMLEDAIAAALAAG